MKLVDVVYRQGAAFWKFLGFFQSPVLRVVHTLVVACVLLQFASSGLMHVRNGVSFFGWVHISMGIGVCLLTLVLTGLSLGRHGLAHFFPYLWGDFEQLRKDIQETLQGKLVPTRPKGLAAVVQGLGLGALWLTAGSGLLWFILWRSGVGGAWFFKEMHEWVVGLLIAYCIGHGGMALVHFSAWQRNLSRQEKKI